MPVEITDLTSLNPDDVQTTLLLLIQQLQEANPSLDLRRGVLHDLLALYHATLTTRAAAELDRYLSARSLTLIAADPTLADPGIVDDVLSNWRLSREDGETAHGEVTIVLTSPNQVTIGLGLVFTSDGQTFTADAAYTAKTKAALINNASDRLLIQLPDGNWAFTVDVTATGAGTAWMIKKDALIVPAALPLGYLTSYVTADFAGGADPETNAQLLDRLLQGFASKAPSNRVTMTAMLRAQPDFVRVTAQSIIGFGDREMRRDKHSVLPMAFPGRCDWYVRTQPVVAAITLSKPATLLALDGNGHGTWQIEIGRQDSPGFYEVASIKPAGAGPEFVGTFPILDDIRAVDLTGPGFIPDIVEISEGLFTCFQTSIIRFLDTGSDQLALVAGAVRNYDVTVRGLGQIGDIQDFVSGFDIRSYGSDVLIKAPVPCFLQLSFTIAKKNTQPDPDTAAIAAALADEVNSVDFVGRLYAGRLQDIIHGFLPAGMSAGAIDMFGRILGPDNVNRYIRASDILIVPELPELMISDRTVQFFIDPSAIAISIQTDVPVPA